MSIFDPSDPWRPNFPPSLDIQPLSKDDWTHEQHAHERPNGSRNSRRDDDDNSANEQERWWTERQQQSIGEWGIAGKVWRVVASFFLVCSIP